MTCNKKWIVYNNQWQPPQWLVQENAPKYFPKPNFHQKTVTVSLVVCCLSDPRQLSESWGNHYIWEVHSVNQWDTLKIPIPAAGIGLQRQHLTSHHTTKASKVEWIRLWSFASSAIFTWPLANWLPLPQTSWQLFAGKVLSQLARGRKSFPRVHSSLKHRYLCYRNKQTYFSLAKIYWL